MRTVGLVAPLLAGVSLLAQDVAHSRQHVALVLEGGGALGFAHIGVIRYLEEHHIPVDLVVGTSMGGLVAGLYAIGESPDEIEKLTNRIDWDAVLSGETEFQDQSFRRKEDRVAFQNRLEFGLKHKRLTLPAGLNSGHQTGLVIDRATLAYDNNLDFNDFPIAFRCVATDVTAGRVKVFERGSIAHALRATMAIPAVFSPVNIDGHFYTDGGAVDNLPVDVAKQAGADIVIAVYLDPGPVDPASYNSLLSMAERNVSIMISANELHNMKAADILLSADVHGFTSASFKAGNEIIPRGYQAAQQKEKMLAGLSVSESTWQAYLTSRNSRIKRAVPTPQFVQVLGERPDYNAALRDSLAGFIGKPIDPPKLEQALTRFTGNGPVSSIGYTGITRAGRTGLEVDPYEKSYGPPFLNLGLSIDGSDPNNVLFGMAARLTFLDLGGYRAEWRTDGFFGSIYGLRSEYYRPFSAQSKWFVAPRLYAISSAFDEYSGKDRLAQYRFNRDGFGGDVGYAVSRNSELRLGEDLLWFRTVKKIADDPLPNISERQAVSNLHYRYYRVDNPEIPRSGFNIDATFNWFQVTLNANGFPEAEIRTSFFKPVSRSGSILFTASGGSAFGTKPAELGLQFFTLGGPLRLGAFGQNQLVGSQYYLFQGGYERKLLSFSPLIGEGLYALAVFEVGKVQGVQPGVPSLPLDGSFALAARTAIGPMYVGGSYGNAGFRKWWFGVGRIF